jgi:hypothetical protein
MGWGREGMIEGDCGLRGIFCHRRDHGTLWFCGGEREIYGRPWRIREKLVGAGIGRGSVCFICFFVDC